MSDFTRQINGFRYVQTNFGDTLQSVALRELGNASEWANIAWLNGLLPPYLTDDQAQVKAGVVLNGGTIQVPAASADVSADISPDEVFLTDVALTNGRLQFSGGDISLVSGRENLHQALFNRMGTDQGELVFHPDYGANLGRLIGNLGGPVLELVAADYVNAAMAAENRIQSVNGIVPKTIGERLSIAVEVVPISGASLNVTRVF